MGWKRIIFVDLKLIIVYNNKYKGDKKICQQDV